jgi:hypothetical protein
VADFGTVDGWRAGGKSGSLPTGYTRSAQGLIPSYSPSEGNRMLVFSAGNNDFGGSVSQRFATVAGQKYQVMYDMGVVSEAAGRQQALAVILYGRSSLPLINRTEVIQAAGAYSSWVPKVHEFVADGPNVLLAFVDQSGSYAPSSTSNTDLLLDNVRIVAVMNSLTDPIAISQSLRVNQDGFSKITLKGISGVAGSITKYMVISLPKNGNITGVAPDLIYIPKVGYRGPDEFKFIVLDKQNKSLAAKISINVIKKLTKFEEWMKKYNLSDKIINDFDKDSITNGLEYVLGTNPKIKTGSIYFPKSSLSFSDPDGDGKKTRYVVFNYRRSRISLGDPNVAVYVEWRATNKDQWKKVSTINGVIVKTKKKHPGNIDLVSVHIPRTITKNGNFMTRLRVVAR